jgi:antagonist of KipI
MIQVITSGFYSSIQDLGRFNYQQYGVPLSGCMDAFSSKKANALLNNDQGCALIEMTQIGPKLLFKSPTTIAITGANMFPKINDAKISMNKAININFNDLLSFESSSNGHRSYIAFVGGIKSELTLGSRSMFKGISETFKLKKGDLLSIDKNTNKLISNSKIAIPYIHKNNSLISVTKGPEFNQLSKKHIEIIEKSKFTVSINSNRMGYNLKETLKNNLNSIITSIVLPGTVQLTPGGKIIILMKDCQVSGGYPRILQLKEHSINLIAQKKPNDEITFKITL